MLETRQTNKRRILLDQSDNLISNQISPTNIFALNRKFSNNKRAEIIHRTEQALITSRFRNSYPAIMVYYTHLNSQQFDEVPSS